MSKKIRQKITGELYADMKIFDLQLIRAEKNLSQLKVAEMTGYPQSFISVIERGKASAPQEFIDKVASVFGIENIDAYVKEVANPNLKKKIAKRAQAEKKLEAAAGSEASVATDQAIVANFLELLKKKEEKIEKLEAENEQLRQELAALKK